ncbi:MAG: hypothetical protein H7Z39_18625 [Burkholderiaceae bacterium]|nr:hypothetical protein [Burkholderiaceae bacterium]
MSIVYAGGASIIAAPSVGPTLTGDLMLSTAGSWMESAGAAFPFWEQA